MISLNGTMSPNNHMDRSMGFIAVGAMVVSAGVGIYGANKNANTAEGIADADRIQRDKESAKLEKQKEVYRKMEFKNPFQNMENKYEDLTVNQQQAEFQSQQGDQQRANIMQGLRGAAGSSGIAGLAQAMANQGQLQTQRISASIGMQESRNKLAVAGASSSIQTAERQGDQYVQQAEMDRQATLLGMQAGQTAGANLAFQQSQANQMNAQIAQTQAITDGVTGIVQTGIGAQQAGMFSK
tara:strand:- start:600 stop:1319 length:720 start_codon:yes stop_codon:yes gene_type:complete